jgi:hypothetical protein
MQNAHVDRVWETFFREDGKRLLYSEESQSFPLTRPRYLACPTQLSYRLAREAY